MPGGQVASSRNDYMSIGHKHFVELAEELERARRDDVKPRHLHHNMNAAAVRACRFVIAMAKEGRLKNAGGILRIVSITKPSPAEDDTAALGLWRMFVVPWVRPQCPERFRSQKTGVTDLPAVIKDAKGRPVDKHGRPLMWQWSSKPPRDKTDKKAIKAWIRSRPSGRLKGEPVHLGPMSDTGCLDDYDDADSLAHLRAEGGDWANAFLVLESMVQDGGNTEDYREARWFSENTKVPPARLRQAALSGRKAKRVRKKTIDGVVKYSVPDVRRHWPSDM